MKTTYCFIFLRLTIVTFLFLSDTFAQAATPRPIVRLIYFLPNDREPQPDINEKFDTLIKEVQALFANQMAAHGFGRKTFHYETDARGKAVVHHVIGRQTDAYYNNLADTFEIWPEIAGKFDTSKDIYLVAIEISDEILDAGEACGLGSGWNDGGQALVPASGDCFDVDTIAHELGHTFGLDHGFYGRDIENKTVVDFSHDQMLNTYWTAHWLDVHAAFNPPRFVVLDGVDVPSVKMLPLRSAGSPNTFQLRFEITGYNGELHQAQLLKPPNSYSEFPAFVAGKRLATTPNNRVAFVTVGLLPEDRNVYLKMIDKQGVMTQTPDFPIDITPFLPSASDFYAPTRALGKGGAADIAYSPDGAHFAVAGDGISLYDAQTQRSVNLLEGAAGDISSVVYSPDGQRIAGGYWKYAYVWDVGTGKILHTRSGKTYVLDVAFSPDGQMLAIAGSDGSIRLWDFGKNIIHQTLMHRAVNVNSVAFSPDGRTLASGGADDTVRLWDVRMGKILHTLKGHQDRVESVAFSPDGRTLASGGLDDTVYLWDVRTGRVRDTFNQHGWIFSVAFSPNGKTLASSGIGSIRLWDVRTGEIREEFDGHNPYLVSSVAFSPDGNTLASLSPQDSNICLWDIDTGLSRHTFSEFTAGGIGMILFSPDGRTLASQEENVIRLWDVATNTVRHTLTGIGQRVSFAFSPDSQTIVCEVWLDESSIYLWDVDTGEIQRDIPVADNETAGSVAFSPNGQTLAGAIASKSGSKGSIRLWDVRTGRVKSESAVEILTGNEVFSPDMRTLANGLWDGRIHLYDVRTGKIRHTLTGHQDSVDHLAFSPDSKILASSGSDTTIRLWDGRTGRHLHTLIGHRSLSNPVAFHPNSQTLASGLSPVYLWDVKTGRHRKTLKVPGGISGLAFSPDGQILAGASQGKVQFWEASSNLPLPVSLSSFRAEQTTAGVLLKWTTTSELDNAGFYIYRSQNKASEFKVVNPTMIPGAGTTAERNEYTWTDTTATPNTVYYYRIEDVSHAGAREQLATVRVRGLVSAKDKMTIRWADLKTQ